MRIWDSSWIAVIEASCRTQRHGGSFLVVQEFIINRNHQQGGKEDEMGRLMDKLIQYMINCRN